MANIESLRERRKRLRSLDEFEPPPWARRSRRRTVAPFAPMLALFAAAGAAIGWVLPF